MSTTGGRPSVARHVQPSSTKPSRWPARRRELTAGAVRAGLGALQALGPTAAGAVAERLWFRPPRVPAHVRGRNADLLSHADPLTVRVNGRTLRGWALGDGPVAMLVHGWGGWAAQYAQIATALAARGIRAVSVDLPGHGADRASRSDLFQFADALHALADRQGSPAVLVAHSAGAMAVTMAFDDPPPPAAVFVAPALSADAGLSAFARGLGLSASAGQVLRRRVQAYVGDAWPLITFGADLQWPHGPLLVVHDRDDPQTPFALSAALAERQTHVELLAVNGLGHNRVLRDPSVVQAVAGFAAARAGTAAAGPAASATT